MAAGRIRRFYRIRFCMHQPSLAHIFWTGSFLAISCFVSFVGEIGILFMLGATPYKIIHRMCGDTA